VRSIEVRPAEARVAVYRCDRCGKEIPSGRPKVGTAEGLLEGADLSARNVEGWTPLIPEREDYGTHGPAFHAANVDICGSCLTSLRAWFAEIEGEAT